MFLTFLKGFGFGGGLIVAIGAQNAFVLSNGIKKNHSIAIALVCSLCDAALIAVGIAGVGAVVATSPALAQISLWGGAVFLLHYGFLAFKSAMVGGQLNAQEETSGSLTTILMATLAVTLLNPHVYLDTIVLMGSISSQFTGNSRLFFGAGAITASFIWFFSLSLGGKILAPLFRKPSSWRVLDTLVGITMWAIAASLVIKA